MATRKVCGIETEYGIHVSGGDPNPIAASSVLVNAYATATARQRTSWDFDDESPGNDARGAAPPGSAAPQIETHLVNTVLTNGARFYVDHAHPEYSSPECANALEALRYDRAGEEVLLRAMRAAVDLAPDRTIVVYKNNSDGKGNSYGCHENYLMDRAIPFARVAAGVTPHLVTRQVFAGAGKVGSETSQLGGEPVAFQLSSRAEFFEEPIGLETTIKRPIVNTRDEPHADSQRFRRLHVIVGDANLSEVATFLKLGTTSLVLAMIEDGADPDGSLELADPVRAIHAISADPALAATVTLADGTSATALEIQWELLAAAQCYADSHGLEALGPEEVGKLVLERWELALAGLERNPAELVRQLDWVAKLHMMNGYRERHGVDWRDDRLAAMDLQYHDLRPERSLFRRVRMERLVDEADVESAVTEPPEDTRAYFRGQCLARWPDAVVSANWDSLVLDLGADPLRRIPMMDPLRGTAEHVGALLRECASPADLVERLGR